MNNDKELLTLAAKAAGIEIDSEDEITEWYAKGYEENGSVIAYWNPLTDDGDALRLAVRLGLDIGFPREDCVWSFGHGGSVCVENPKEDPYAATRRAIVRAAAEIGRGME